MVYLIYLPLPISVNRLWRYTSRGRSRAYASKEYTEWKKQADLMALEQHIKIPPKPLDRFVIDLTFSSVFRRGNADGDNLIKCVLDWIEDKGFVTSDSRCEGGAWAWGYPKAGCQVILGPWNSTPGEDSPSR